MRLGIVPAVVALLVAGSGLTPAAAASDATLTGHVTDSGSTPVADIQVCAYPATTTDPGAPTGCAFTSAAGSYTLVVPAGSYRVLFTDTTSGDLATQAYPGADGLALGTPVTAPAGATVPGLDATLRSRPTIAGRVTDSSAPLEGVRVCLLAAVAGTWQELRCRYSDAEGRYHLPADPGTYRLGLADDFGSPWRRTYWGGGSDVASGADIVVTAAGRTGIDQVVPAAARIRGTVAVAGVSGADPTAVQVCVFPATGADVLGCAEPDLDGSYSLPLPPGTYRVGFLPYDGWNLKAQYFANSSTLAAATILTVLDSDVTKVDATMAQGGRITGTVTGVAEQPLDTFTACAVSRSDLPPTSGACVTKQPGSNTFQIAVVPGTYRLWVSGKQAGRTITRWYADAASFAAAEPLAVNAGGQRDVTVELVEPVIPSPTTPTPRPTTPTPSPRPTVRATATVLAGWPKRLAARKGRAAVVVTAAPARGRTGQLQRQVCRSACRWTVVRTVRWPAQARASVSVGVTTSKKKRTRYRLVLPATTWGKAVTSGTLTVRYKR